MWGRGASKVWRVRGRTGGLEAHFFTQNSGIIFFEGHAEKDAFDRRVKNVSQINGDAFEKMSRNSPGGVSDEAAERHGVEE